jgi:hypothetical protein
MTSTFWHVTRSLRKVIAHNTCTLNAAIHELGLKAPCFTEVG